MYRIHCLDVMFIYNSGVCVVFYLFVSIFTAIIYFSYGIKKQFIRTA
jgi:hypothetical protein